MIFKKTRVLEKDTDKLLTKILDIGMSFREGLNEYFNGRADSFSQYVDKCDALESEVDHIRKDIEHNLYTDMLIPESRGDVLGLLEALDDVVDETADVILKFDIEKPKIPKLIFYDMDKMAEYTSLCIEELIKAVTSFFTGSDQITLYINKVKFYENEIDRLETGMKRKIFGEEVKGLATRIQLQSFIEKIADISDFAEHVCERLSISVIKRSI